MTDESSLLLFLALVTVLVVCFVCAFIKSPPMRFFVGLLLIGGVMTAAVHSAREHNERMVELERKAAQAVQERKLERMAYPYGRPEPVGEATLQARVREERAKLPQWDRYGKPINR